MKKWMYGAALAACLATAQVVAAAPAVGQVGSMAGDWSGLIGIDGKTYNLKDYQGKVVFIMTVQWNCGGCNANAPAIGAIADKFKGKPFQAFGPDINFATKNQLGTFQTNLKKNAPNVDFPLLQGLGHDVIKDSVDSRGNTVGTMWTPYDALRDVYFVLDHTGKIVARIDGNRGSALQADRYTALETAITAAIANVPTVAIASVSGDRGILLRASKGMGRYQIDFNPGRSHAGDVTLKILDPQGRLVRTVEWDARNSGAAANGAQAVWDGRDAQGRSVPWGQYYLNATGAGSSVSLLLSWLP